MTDSGPDTTAQEQSPIEVAEAWEAWCGDTTWSRGLRALHGKAMIRWWCGYPRSASAIPLTFVIRTNDGHVFRGSRLRDIQSAIAHVGRLTRTLAD